MAALQTKVGVSHANVSTENCIQLMRLLGIEEIANSSTETPTLLQIVNFCIEKSFEFSTVVRGFILTKGCGCFVSRLMPVCKYVCIVQLFGGDFDYYGTHSNCNTIDTGF